MKGCIIYVGIRDYTKKGGIFMNIQKFTKKSVEALEEAQSIASRNSNPQIEQEHLLLALL